GGRPRHAGAWRHRVFPAQAVRAYLSPSPALSHYRRVGRNPDEKNCRPPVRLHGTKTKRIFRDGATVEDETLMSDTPAKTNHADIAAKLRDVVAHLLGPPGDILELRRLTAGATKATWAFKAQIGDANLPLILQLSNGSSRSGDNAALPLVAGAEDAA